MIRIDIPGRERELILEKLVLDYNGTIAADGRLIEEDRELIKKLAESLEVFVLTADTYGTVEKECEGLGVTVKTFPREGAGIFKEKIVKEMGGGVCAVGNGFNDTAMCKAAELSIAVLDEEGLCPELLKWADILVRSSADALNLLLKPDRIRATLRN